MNISKKTIFSAFFLLALCGPQFAFAAEIRLDSHKAEVKIGEQFAVDIIVNSEEPLNAIEGRLIFQEDLLSVQEIRDGNSSVNLWIEKPHIESPGTIFFSGITPGGWDGANSLIFTVLFEAKKDGNTSIMFQGVTALRNDGVGTKESISIRNVYIVIEPGDSKVRKEEFTDTEPPEDFTPIISEDKNLFEGKYSLIFATQDKGTGIRHYEVKEFRFTFFSFLSPWTRADSPYILKDQNLKSHIVVKAIDNSGNERITTILPHYPLLWYDFLSIFVILIVVVASCVFIFINLWRKKQF